MPERGRVGAALAFLEQRLEAALFQAEFGALGQDLCGDDPLFKTALAMRERAVKVLKENPKISNPYPNVDAVSGTLLNASGLTESDYYTLLFGFARIAGITAQIVDERVHMRNGRGVPIYRCSYVAENQEPKRLS